MTNAHETRAVLSSRYLVEQTTQRTHTVSIDREGWETVLCSRVKVESLADRYAGDVNAAPTCPSCRRRDPRFSETR